MSNNNVVDFFTHFEKKQNQQRLQEELNASGWEISDEINSTDSEVCVYLMDTKEPCVILFGTKFDQLPIAGEKASIDWQHFVLAWDVIADPEMPFDETHKRSTMDLSLSALGGVENWESCRKRLCGAQDNKRPHLLILIDRENMNAPRELIVAYSESRVLNTESLRAIVDSYMSA